MLRLGREERHTWLLVIVSILSVPLVLWLVGRYTLAARGEPPLWALTDGEYYALTWVRMGGEFHPKRVERRYLGTNYASVAIYGTRRGDEVAVVYNLQMGSRKVNLSRGVSRQEALDLVHEAGYTGNYPATLMDRCYPGPSLEEPFWLIKAGLDCYDPEGQRCEHSIGIVLTSEPAFYRFLPGGNWSLELTPYTPPSGQQ